MSNKNQYIVPHKDGWAVRGEGNKRVTSIHNTQKEAISSGRNTAIKNTSELRIQNSEGKFRDAWSYGNDPKNVKG